MPDLTFWQVTGVIVGVFLALAGGASVMVVVIRKLLASEQGYPGEAQIEEALRKYAGFAIIAAYKLSEVAVDEFKLRLEGLDKKQIADHLYDMLPDHITIGKFVVPISWVKRFVSKERFAEIVQSVFDEAMDGVEQLLELYREHLGEFLEPLQP
jgi:hypothetical protein